MKSLALKGLGKFTLSIGLLIAFVVATIFICYDDRTISVPDESLTMILFSVGLLGIIFGIRRTPHE
jgi:hypothetical protein